MIFKKVTMRTYQRSQKSNVVRFVHSTRISFCYGIQTRKKYFVQVERKNAAIDVFFLLSDILFLLWYSKRTFSRHCSSLLLLLESISF